MKKKNPCFKNTWLQGHNICQGMKSVFDEQKKIREIADNDSAD